MHLHGSAYVRIPTHSGHCASPGRSACASLGDSVLHDSAADVVGSAGTQWMRHRRAAALSIALGTSVLPLWSAPKSDCGNAVDAVLKAYQVRACTPQYGALHLRCNATSAALQCS